MQKPLRDILKFYTYSRKLSVLGDVTSVISDKETCQVREHKQCNARWCKHKQRHFVKIPKVTSAKESGKWSCIISCDETHHGTRAAATSAGRCMSGCKECLLTWQY